MSDRDDLADEPFEIEDIGSNPSPGRPIGALIEARLSRRAAMLGVVGAGAAVTLQVPIPGAAQAQPVPVPREGGRRP